MLYQKHLILCVTLNSHFPKGFGFFLYVMFNNRSLIEFVAVYFQNDFQMHCLSARSSENVSNTTDKHILLFL